MGKDRSKIVYTDSLQDNFDQIYLLYYARMFRFAKEYVVSDEEAENIVQDVFMKLWEKRDVLNIQISLISYIFSLVKNQCLDFLRHQAVVKEAENTLYLKLVALEQLNYSFPTEEDVELLLMNAIDSLPERCREIFMKSRIEGKKYKTIADELNISVNTVENQIGIALKKLRVQLKDYLSLFIFLCFC